MLIIIFHRERLPITYKQRITLTIIMPGIPSDCFPSGSCMIAPLYGTVHLHTEMSNMSASGM
ncbi:hypothetical protein K0G70_22115 [Bacteroides fragilis]|uniref:hypothetical protein n=1 Tax=Bacteroides fragilis TaxID=817 RepID=UPI0004ADBA16|nr:hypothetical protein [Bacteroides fragilis]MBA5649959.1 hypothetical protein [Bacteroides fragilis]MCE9260444.1 hypothetical protein [Bacteroides fragilis]MCE9288710.1 hypothetical protein [Bacteroides fragilis]MCE9302893.1 hypothetical protein [Bacteroides fragilis]MCS2991528.1 hypothetical protein [Bacteroides fragilis]